MCRKTHDKPQAERNKIMDKIDLRQVGGKACFVSSEKDGEKIYPIYFTTNLVQPEKTSMNVYAEMILIGGYDTKANQYISANSDLLKDVDKDINSVEFDLLDYKLEDALKEQGYSILNYNDTLNNLLAERENRPVTPIFEIEDGVLKKYNGHDKIVNIPDDVVAIDDKVFKHNAEICCVTFPQGLKSIGDSAFAFCENLSDAFFKHYGECERIGIAAFTGCKKLHIREFPKNLKELGNYAFSNCESLEEIKIPNIIVVPFGAFQGCTNLRKVTIDEGVVSIAGEAFWGCENLKKLSVPSTLVDMGQAAFNKCYSLEQLKLPEKFNTAVLKYAELPQSCSYECCIPEYSKYEGMTISEFFKSIENTDYDGDFDMGDNVYDTVVCCCCPDFEDLENSTDADDKYTKFIYDNVKIITAKPDKYFVVADWTGFVEEHFDKLKEYTRQSWVRDYDDKDEFTYQWIKETHLMLAGYVSEKCYSDFLRVVADDDTSATKELDLTEQERGRS